MFTLPLDSMGHRYIGTTVMMHRTANFWYVNKKAVSTTREEATSNASLGVNWSLIGTVINGSASNAYFGYSVSLNSDGNILVVGSPRSRNTKGEAKVYSWDGDKWAISATFNGSEVGDYAGTYVSIALGGCVMAISSTWLFSNNTYTGSVSTYFWNQFTWVKFGQTFLGKQAFDYLGSSIALNADGYRLAFGAPNQNNGNGVVRVYEWNQTSWVQMGDDIIGGGYFGYSLALNGDGNIVAVGSITANSNRGEVRVLYYDGIDWSTHILSPESTDISFGVHISLSTTGTVLATGAYTVSRQGVVRLYSWTGSKWKTESQLNTVNDGEDFSFALREDGALVAFGAPAIDSEGMKDSGQAMVYAQPGASLPIFEHCLTYEPTSKPSGIPSHQPTGQPSNPSQSLHPTIGAVGTDDNSLSGDSNIDPMFEGSVGSVVLGAVFVFVLVVVFSAIVFALGSILFSSEAAGGSVAQLPIILGQEPYVSNGAEAAEPNMADIYENVGDVSEAVNWTSI
eukprot:gene25203-30444_t